MTPLTSPVLPAPAAPPALPEYAISLFSGKTSNTPEVKRVTWAQLCKALTSRSVRAGKDGRLFSPAFYPLVLKRADKNVESLSLLVLDFDNGMAPGPLKKRWEAAGYAFIVYSSHSNEADFPKWRAVFPLAAPVPASEWPAAYEAMAETLGQGQIDTSCRDASRMYYLPSCPAETEACAFAFHVSGAALVPADFTPKEEPPAAPVQVAAPPDYAPPSGTLPGTDFDNRGAGIALDLLIGAGWKARRHGEGWHLTRPGKELKQGLSATFNICAPNCLHVFSPNAAPFKDGENYSPFAIYAQLKHGGDLSAAAAALYAENYGDRVKQTRAKDDRPLIMRPPAPIEPDAVLTFEQWKAYGKKIQRWKSRCDDEFRWQGGDWWNAKTEEIPHGEKVTFLKKTFGDNLARQLRNAASICKKWPAESRFRERPFWWHVEMAGQADEVKAEYAEKTDMGRDAIRAALKIPDEPRRPKTLYQLFRETFPEKICGMLLKAAETQEVTTIYKKIEAALGAGGYNAAAPQAEYMPDYALIDDAQEHVRQLGAAQEAEAGENEDAETGRNLALQKSRRVIFETDFQSQNDAFSAKKVEAVFEEESEDFSADFAAPLELLETVEPVGDSDAGGAGESVYNIYTNIVPFPEPDAEDWNDPPTHAVVSAAPVLSVLTVPPADEAEEPDAPPDLLAPFAALLTANLPEAISEAIRVPGFPYLKIDAPALAVRTAARDVRAAKNERAAAQPLALLSAAAAWYERQTELCEAEP